ncbi:tyrosine-type recombinase/integrase [Xanthobacter oligotrophicus]|uniref:tyrosine-type recombinase/integrase n=1 Tax=Xanthobacter oligotrophicus TaxID=2607286 RepID=UPI001AEDE638|nr:site-specific integrase [Xanthobacter oligotrophicus]MCG5237127.1 tyrosine-type recombinase/integrase [Xanthobacter oligotrophicus]
MSGDGVRKPAKALTAAFVRSVKEPGRYFDGHGLFLRVMPGGSRQWVQRIVVRGKRSEIGLGGADLVSLAAARTAALANRSVARSGGDPLQARRDAAGIPTFETAARTVHEAAKPTWRNAKHADDFINSLTMYAFPKIGTRKLTEITSGDIHGVLEPIWTSKPETARRVKQRIDTTMKWAVAKGYRLDNPAESVAKGLPRHDRMTKAHRKALPYADVATCIDAVKASRAWVATKLTLEFLILTAARSGEVRLAEWKEIDIEAARWTVPASRMKMKKEHVVPLSARAMEILAEADKLKGESELVFPSARGSALSDMTLSKLVKELGFAADVHGMRTSFRTWAQEQTNFPFEVCEAALAHSVGDGVSQAYARSDVFEKRRKLMDAWTSYLAVKRGEIVALADRQAGAA